MLTIVVSAAPVCAQRPWLRSDVRFERDNQVRSAQHVGANYGWYLSPNVTLAAAAGLLHASGELPVSGTAETTTATAGLISTFAIPSARIGLEIGAHALFGASNNNNQSSTNVLYAATARAGLGGGSAVRLHANREHYTATVASLDTLLFMRTVEIALDRAAAPGWAGEAVARRSDFGDDNPINTAFAWLLAPLSRSATHSLRAGFAVAWQDSEHSNWVPDATAPSAAAPQQVAGYYTPYYTPHDVSTQSVLVNAAQAVGRSWLIIDGALPLHAKETAPLLIRSTPSPQSPPLLTFYERSFHPLRAQLALVVPAGTHASVKIVSAYERTAYYRTGSLLLTVARTF